MHDGKCKNGNEHVTDTERHGKYGVLSTEYGVQNKTLISEGNNENT